MPGFISQVEAQGRERSLLVVVGHTARVTQQNLTRPASLPAPPPPQIPAGCGNSSDFLYRVTPLSV